jgi:SNF2 family DNA or RNA helicase
MANGGMTSGPVILSPETIAIIEEMKNKYGRVNDIKFPSWYSFKTEPYKHQSEALDLMYGLNASALFMEMGTGKTKAAIDNACAHFLENHINAVLIMCPNAIRKTWQRELQIHCPLEYNVHLLDMKKKKAFDKWMGQDLINPEKITYLVAALESLSQGRGHELIERFLLATNAYMYVDESSRIKNHRSNVAKKSEALGRICKYRTIMTGTSVTNGPMDLYMQFEFLDPDIIGVGDFYSFRNRYAIMGGYEDRQIIGYDNIEELTDIIRPYTYQALKKDVLKEIPPKTYTKRFVTLSGEQKKLYDYMKRNKAIHPSTGKTLVCQNVLEHALRSHQICGGFYAYEKGKIVNPKTGKEKIIFEYERLNTNPKVNEVMAIAAESTSQVIIWCTYDEEIDATCEALRKEYGDDQVVELHGRVDDDTRDVNVYEKFQKGKVRFIVGNAMTGGMGLTMTNAEIVIYFSNTFKLEDRLQSEDRAHRSGQTKKVLYIDLVYEDTIDVTVLDALVNKKDMSDYIADRLADGVSEEDIMTGSNLR